MGFAWHKLIPRHPSTPSVCPPPCIDTGGWVTSISSICAPQNPNGTVACATFDLVDYPTGGLQCGGKPVLVGGYRTNPGAPIELRLNAPLDCTAPNDPALSGSNNQKCDMGSAGVDLQYYYYRTPNSPSSPPAKIDFEKLCLKFNPYAIPDRLMVISGRNRYKYGGWGVDPSCGVAGEEGGPPSLWDTVIVGGTGIRQAEESLGRSWPLPNSVLNLPLFGANTSANPSTPPSPCSDGACSDPSCFSTRGNDGTGHFGRSDQGNGKGYYSFQCFNPMGFYGGGPFTSIPTCSLWSLIQAIWFQAWQGADESDAKTTIYPNTWTAVSNLLNADPSQLTSGKSNVRHYLDALVAAMQGEFLSSVIFPNVFLWDRDAYVAASTNEDKWKHIYTVGNGNVVFDTQCMLGLGGINDLYGFVIHLDEVVHDPTYGSTGNARLVGFFGCNASNGNNPNSNAYFGISTMNCVPTQNPKTGVFATYCDECANEGIIDLNVNSCYHYGYDSDCSVSWPQP